MVIAPYILKHHLGTNRIGEDVASGLVHGTSIALKVGLVSMAIAAFFGIILGALAGYFGDHKITVSRGSFYLALPGLFFGYFYGFVVRYGALKNAFHAGFLISIVQILLSIGILITITLLFGSGGKLLNRVAFFRKKTFVPVDIFISRFIEIFDSIPSLLLIITISSVFVEKSLSLVMVIIGVIAAPHIARLTRAEFLRIRNLEYVQSARTLGFGDMRIIIKHILPNALAPVFVYIAFGIASAIIAESSLSFLGIGVPADTVTWGSLLSYARDEYGAWWMTVFPGLAIFITVTVYNLAGEGLREALDPRMRV
jgi:peptide/nickel transport system permease protein